MGRKSSSNVAVFVRLFLIVAMAMVCVLTFCSCDTKDVESLFQPSDFTVTFVLNNGAKGMPFPLRRRKILSFYTGVRTPTLRQKPISILKS